MEYKPSRKTVNSPFVDPLTPSIDNIYTSLQDSKIKNTLSQNRYNFKSLFPCVNHKRKRAIYIVQLQEGEMVHFCQKCMIMVKNMGFGGLKIQENHRIQSHNVCYKQTQQTRYQKNKSLNSFLDKIKDLYEELSSFKDTLAQVSIDYPQSQNQNYIHNLFSKLQHQLQTLKAQFEAQMNVYHKQFTKGYNEIVCKAAWNQQDLQQMISRICKNYEKLLAEPTDKFQINLSLMKEAFELKSLSLQKIQKQYVQWKQKYQIYIDTINQEWVYKLIKAYKSIFNNQRLYQHNQNIQKLTFSEISPICPKIIQQLSTSNTLS